MLIGKFLKFFNCAVRSIPSGHHSSRQLSGTARIIEDINLEKCIGRIACDADFYKLTRVSKNEIGALNSKTIGVIPDPYAWERNFSKSIEQKFHLAGLLKRKWNNRSKTETTEATEEMEEVDKVEESLGKILSKSNFEPSRHGVGFSMGPSPAPVVHPVMILSNSGSGTTIKMLSKNTKTVGVDPFERIYVLDKISRKQALKIPPSKLAIKFNDPSEESSDQSEN